MDTTEKAARVKKFLKQAWLDWCREQGEVRSQADFARWMGIKPSSVSQWINGLRFPEGENLAKLALFLGEGIYEALGIEKGEETSTQLTEIASVWPSLIPENRQRALEFIRQQLEGQNNESTAEG